MAAETTTFEFTFAHAEGWVLYLFILGAVALGWWGWRRYGPAPAGLAGRIARCCRVAALVLVVLALAGPGWQRTTRISEPGSLAVLVDQSASMSRTDVFGEGGRIQAAPRLAQALDKLPPGSARVHWWRIGGAVEQADRPAADISATGGFSGLGNDVEQVAFTQDPDLVILLSDGRVTQGSSFFALARELTKRAVPAKGVWALGVGGELVEAEMHIDEILAPREIPLGERQPVVVRASVRALDPSKDIEIIIKDGDKVLDQATIQAPQGEPEDLLTPLSIEKQLDRTVLFEQGEHRLTVELKQGELTTTAGFTVEVQERKLHVLMLAHRPRYELRYLRQALIRDNNIRLTSYLADGRWRPWGEVPAGLQELPLLPELLKDFDAIIIGDFSAERLTEKELESLSKAVKEGGAGVIWLPGESGAIASFLSKKFGELLPVKLGSAADIADGYAGNKEIRIKRSDDAERFSLLRADETAWDRLPLLRGASPVIKKKAGTLTLMEDADSGDPLVVMGDFGAGKSLFVGFDDSWRWRRDVGDKHLHHFWSQLLRHVSSGRAGGDTKWRIVAAPRRTVPGDIVQIGIVPTGPRGDGTSLPDQATIKLEGPGDRSQVLTLDRPLGEEAYLANIPAPGPGTWTIEALDMVEATASGELVVLPPSNELRDPRIDRQGLAELAEDTGGQAFFIRPDTADPDQTIDDLVKALPGLARQQQRIDHPSLWDSWWTMVILAALLATEWAIRRWCRLP